MFCFLLLLLHCSFFQKELDAEAARLHSELAAEQEAFRLQVQDFAQKALEEEETRMRAETDREKELYRVQVRIVG